MSWAAAVTGSIGCGKSRCCRWLATRYDLTYIDADAVGRQLIAPGGPAYEPLRRLLPPEFFADDGRPLRPRIRAALAADPQLRRRLEELLHPRIRQAIQARRLASRRPCLVEVPLLFEAGWHDDFPAVVVVWARRASRIRRLCQRDGIHREEAARIVATQGSLAAKALRAHHVVDNSGPWAATLVDLLRLGEILRSRAAEQG